MPNRTTHPRLTPRDLEILAALDHCPLTVQQLLKLSCTLVRPFPNERRVRERMQSLCQLGLAGRDTYATAGCGAPAYFRLARPGFQLLHGPDAAVPTKRYFRPLGIGRQHHTHALADFIVHTAVAAHEAGILLDGVYRENTFRLAYQGEALFPDAAFQLIGADGRSLKFFVELDNSTERLESRSGESWERKIRLYDGFQDTCDSRFRVLIATTRSRERLDHILKLAAVRSKNPARSLFYGIHLPDYLREQDAVRRACFRDHRGTRVALVPLKGDDDQQVVGRTELATATAS
jgi:hypothetical protein